jgi:hypothetical protein
MKTGRTASRAIGQWQPPRRWGGQGPPSIRLSAPANTALSSKRINAPEQKDEPLNATPPAAQRAGLGLGSDGGGEKRVADGGDSTRLNRGGC